MDPTGEGLQRTPPDSLPHNQKLPGYGTIFTTQTEMDDKANQVCYSLPFKVREIYEEVVFIILVICKMCCDIPPLVSETTILVFYIYIYVCKTFLAKFF